MCFIIAGPMLLFEKASSTSSFRFFACSAFRSRNDCTFYLLEKDASKKKIMEFAARSRQLVTISYMEKYKTYVLSKYFLFILIKMFESAGSLD